MASQKVQHYIPRFYLEKFVNQPENIKHDPSVWVYDLNNINESKRKSPSNTGHISYYYDYIDCDPKNTKHAENLLSKIENDAAPILKEIIKSENINFLSEEQWYVFARFISFMYCRTPRARKLDNQIIGHELKTVIVEQINTVKKPDEFKDVSYDDLKDILNSKWDIPKNILIDNVFQNAFKLAEHFACRNWYLWKSKNANFITSDHPIILINDEVENKLTCVGIGRENTDFIFPLSPTLCLFGTYKSSQEKCINTSEVNEVNHMTIKNSEQYIYSSTEQTKYIGNI
jgi:hypothetical protein